MKKIILYGAGTFGLRALNLYKDRVAFFCDRRNAENGIAGVPVISFDELKKIWKDYDVVVTPLAGEARNQIQNNLREHGIDFSVFTTMEDLLRLHGEFPNIYYEGETKKIFQSRMNSILSMYKTMFQEFAPMFSGKMLDIWIHIWGEFPIFAYDKAREMELHYIHSYATMYSLKNRVIPIPDYFSFYAGGELPPEISPNTLRMAALEPWKDNRMYWRGTLFAHRDRSLLHTLGQQYPQYLHIESSSQGARVPMYEQAKYKYLIDVRGHGWTDRVKILLQLGRPLFLVDRPDREWYFDQLVPMKHYVPVKEDFSDLIEKIQYLEEHPEVYDEIVKNALEFSDKVLNAKVLEYLRDVTLKYDVVDELDDRKWPWNPEACRKGMLLE